MKMGTLPVTEHQMAADQPTTVFFSTFFLACAASLLIGIIFSAGFFGKMILKNPAQKSAYVLKGKDFHALTDPGAKKFKNVRYGSSGVFERISRQLST